eukprot:95146_1
MSTQSLVSIVLIETLSCLSCDYFIEGPIKIEDTSMVDHILIGDILQISFELQILDGGCVEEWCDIFQIGGGGTNYIYPRLPLLSLNGWDNNYFHVPFSLNTDPNNNYITGDSYFSSSIISGNYNKFYLKFSYTDRMFIFNDNITYINITNGEYDSSNLIYKQYPLWIKHTRTFHGKKLNGYFKNICINTTIYPRSQSIDDNQVFTEQSILSPMDSYNNAFNVEIMNYSEVYIVDNAGWEWQINDTDHIGFSLKISSNDTNYKWNFHDTVASTLQLVINSNNFHTSLEQNLLITFSISSVKYFAVIINMDNGINDNNLLYPQCNSNYNQYATGDVETISNDDNGLNIIDKIFYNQNGSILQPAIDHNGWPLLLSIINYPSQNHSQFRLTNGYTNISQSCNFSESIKFDDKLEIFIATMDSAEIYGFSSFVVNKYYLHTSSPTQQPSMSPTSSPTVSPTFSPTTPTKIPSDSPTTKPTISPTNSPTYSPTTNYAYSMIININYLITNLTSQNIQILEDDTENVANDIIAILAQNYLLSNVVEYEQFIIRFKDINQHEDLSKTQLKSNEVIVIHGEILSIADIDQMLIEISKSIQFEVDVTNDLKLYFVNNPGLTFNVQNKSSLTSVLLNDTTLTTINLWNESILLTGICLALFLFFTSVLYHILCGCCLRLRGQRNISWSQYVKLLTPSDKVLLIISICIELFDIITDFLFGSQLLNKSKTSNILELQYYGLFVVLFAFFGLTICGIKTLLTRSIYGNTKFIQCKINVNKFPHGHDESLSFIRKLKRDIIVMDWYTISLEDIPQITIILNINYSFGIEIRDYSKIAFLSFCINVISILFKTVIRLILNETGLLNPSPTNVSYAQIQTVSNESGHSIKPSSLQITDLTNHTI